MNEGFGEVFVVVLPWKQWWRFEREAGLGIFRASSPRGQVDRVAGSGGQGSCESCSGLLHIPLDDSRVIFTVQVHVLFN